ncbi:hypothetical protein CEXT_338481 [Caerostris extrusa]|uniref:Uncharacterized protein n=1 Tax=Caerostris extrusa TaxID=172846 RepID=A0AAV4WK84_CAEEX|nr:hypothetical protein CEXT_338481 [Caerostris extrusa]
MMLASKREQIASPTFGVGVSPFGIEKLLFSNDRMVSKFRQLLSQNPRQQWCKIISSHSCLVEYLAKQFHLSLIYLRYPSCKKTATHPVRKNTWKNQRKQKKRHLMKRNSRNPETYAQKKKSLARELCHIVFLFRKLSLHSVRTSEANLKYDTCQQKRTNCFPPLA